MAFKEYRRSGETAEWNVNEVEAYLRAQGFLIGPGGIATGLDVTNGTPSAFVRADLDPNVPDATLTTALDAFVPSPDPVRVARGYLLTRYRAIKAKTVQQRAAATLNENDLFALLTLLRQES